MICNLPLEAKVEPSSLPQCILYLKMEHDKDEKI